MPAPTTSLGSLQRSILQALAGLEPPFVLTGGAAVAGLYFGHRQTRDLDLFWRGRRVLDELPEKVERRLREVGFEVRPIQTTPSFRRYLVRRDTEECVVDLVAEPTELDEAPLSVLVGGAAIRVDSQRALLAAKLCALLGRSEPRDLDDVGRLLDAGTDLTSALALAPKIDGGFSALTLAWVLDRWGLAPAAAAAGYDSAATTRLDGVRRTLVDRLTPVE
jgi:predicted nucleotidyltransferase component of viral defense system